jgi:YD repeat-containing protein
MCTAQSPSTPRPIMASTGSKNLLERDVLVGSIDFKRHYSSKAMLSPDQVALAHEGDADNRNFPVSGKLGLGWRHSFQASMLIGFNGETVLARRPDGRSLQFMRRGDAWTSDADVTDQLIAVRDVSGQVVEWRFVGVQDGITEIYSIDGRLRAVHGLAGLDKTLRYSDGTDGVASGLGGHLRDENGNLTSRVMRPGLLHSVVDRFGRTLGFAYDQSERLVRAQGNGFFVEYAYSDSHCLDCKLLSTVTYGDGSQVSYSYNETSLAPAGSIALLTGVWRNGSRSDKYSYDSAGRAVSSERPGGVARYELSLSHASDISSVTGPDGVVNSYFFQTLHGLPRLTRQSQPAGSGCSAASSAQEYDANANVIRRDDFTGLRSCHAYDLSRNLETSRVEGLVNTQICSTVTPVNAALPSGSRKISTTWHPDWRLPVKIAEPRRLTTHVYNGQPDPFAGNAVASCAPASAKLPDGKPIAVLCKTVEQATYDAGGAAGFAAVLDTSVPNRVWSYTYNEFGQVLTSRDPRGNTTTNTYYTTTTADYTRGDLEKTIGALPTHATRFTKYNPMGQVLQSIDANNVVTDYTYDLRGRLKTQTTAGQSTTYEYWPTGQLKRVTQPDTSYVAYEYDPAQRLVAVADNLGNRIEYTLDNSGRQREERVKDPTGLLKRQVSRVFDALGRTQQVTGRE